MPTRIRRVMKLLIVAVLAAVALTAGLFFVLNTYMKTDLPPGGDFTLQSVGGPRSLHDFAGRGVILYFGYTSCPDACPTSLSYLSSLLKQLPPRDQERILPVFISVDYKADTPQKVDTYMKFFWKSGVGLTGSKAEIDRVVAQYGTSYHYEEDKKSAMGYSVQHGSNFYFISPSGDLVVVESTLAPQKVLMQDFKKIL